MFLWKIQLFNFNVQSHSHMKQKNIWAELIAFVGLQAEKKEESAWVHLTPNFLTNRFAVMTQNDDKHFNKQG